MILREEEDGDTSVVHVGVCLCSVDSTPFTTFDAVGDARVYEGDLGMQRAGQLLRQLQVDVPRCDVRIDGRRERNPITVLIKSPFPRMSTQAVFAPVLEWFIHKDVLVQEHQADRSMRIDVCTAESSMTVTKRFRLLRILDEEYVCDTTVTIYAQCSSNVLIVSNDPEAIVM